MKCKHPNEVSDHFIICLLYGFIFLMFLAFWVKDPCKQCIVKACCSLSCEDRLDFNRYIYPNKTILGLRVISCTVLGSVISLALTIISEII